MERLCRDILSLLVPLYPQLRQEWGRLALDWGTSCPIRSIAFRSLQLFRVLMPQIDRLQLATMIGRITNTISETDRNIQAFTREMLITFVTVVKSDIDPELLPPIFWCACACLSTTMEMEFLTVLNLVDTLLQRLDFNDPATAENLLAHRPAAWSGPQPNLQSLIIVGLRSSVTYDASFALLGKLAKITDAWILEDSENRIRELFTVILPSCLQVKDGGSVSMDITAFANDIARLAERIPSCNNISRLAKSFAKGIIRTREDLLRQGVACIREEFGSQAISLLLGLVCNSERWLRIKSMEILKILFQQPQSRMPLARSELLNPLLRLLSTDLAPHALEVLDEPLAIAAGPSPAHAFRMSMIGIEPSKDDNMETSTSHFNLAPSESGWSIPHTEERIESCRSNTLAVFETCKPNNRPSVINFEPEVRSRLAATSTFFPLENPTPLGDLVSTLNELNDFFEKDGPASTQSSRPRENADTQAAHNRATEILRKSFGRPSNARNASISEETRHRNVPSNGALGSPSLESDQPPTPFIGLFSVAAPQVQGRHGESMSNFNQNFLRSADESDSFEGADSREDYSVRPSGHNTMQRFIGRRAETSGSHFREVDSGSESDDDPYALDRTVPQSFRSFPYRR
jgi:hypothetical protein